MVTDLKDIRITGWVFFLGGIVVFFQFRQFNDQFLGFFIILASVISVLLGLLLLTVRRRDLNTLPRRVKKIRW